VAAVALVGLYPLARLKEVMQNFVQNFNVNYWQGKDPGSIPGSTRGCPHPPSRAKEFPFSTIPFCRMQKSVPLTFIVQSLPPSLAPSLLLKMICICRSGGSGGGGGSGVVRTGINQKR